MSNVVFHRLAIADFAEAVEWYADRSRKAAADFQQEVTDAVERIGSDPSRFLQLDPQHQFHRLRRFPYLVVFRIHHGQVVVVAVAHGRRKAYWRRRR